MIMRALIEHFDEKHEELEGTDTKLSKVKNFMLYFAEGVVDGVLMASPILIMRVIIDNHLIKHAKGIIIK